MDPILSGLAAAHQAGIVHRDVKPENVLLAEDGRVKVVDFGLARAQAAAGSTRAGLIIGTVAYIAPEQVTGGVTDFRTDVYAAGVMAFEMLTGHQPYTGNSPLAVAYQHVNSEVPAAGGYVADIPPAVDQLVRAATSRDPQRRPGDAGAFLGAVRALRGSGGESEAVSGAWAGSAAGVPGAFGAHTMVVAGDDRYQLAGYGTGAAASGGFAYGGGTAYGGGAAYGGGIEYGGEDDYHGHEPFLQRWLFSRRLAYLVAAAVAVIGLGAGGWWLMSGRYTPLPSVDGMQVAAATQALRQAGFAVRTGTPVIDNSVPRGDVISTSPSGRAVKGATIILTVSAGPRMIVVPPVAGESVDAAKATLRRAGLMVSDTTKPVGVAGAVVIGSVAGTTPAAGTSWPANRAVYVDVVAGMALPDFTGQDINTIQGWAGSNNIQLNPVQVDSSQPQGIIVRQSPAPGTPVTAGQAVTVYVSNGPAQVAIPDLRGENFDQAKHELEQLGFQVVGRQFGPGDRVFLVTPMGSAPTGSAITVYYGGL
jgi:serine/threonine-protein kinase